MGIGAWGLFGMLLLLFNLYFWWQCGNRGILLFLHYAFVFLFC